MLFSITQLSNSYKYFLSTIILSLSNFLFLFLCFLQYIDNQTTEMNKYEVQERQRKKVHQKIDFILQPLLIDIMIKKPENCTRFMIEWLEKRKDFLYEQQKQKRNRSQTNQSLMKQPEGPYEIKISKAHHEESLRDSGMSFGGEKN